MTNEAPRDFGEVRPGPDIVVKFADGYVANLGRVDRVLTVSNDEYIVYLSDRRLTCFHVFDEEPEAFGAILAETRRTLATERAYLSEHQYQDLADQMGAAVSLALEDSEEQAQSVLARSAAFASAERKRSADAVLLLSSTVTAVAVIVGASLFGLEGDPGESLGALVRVALQGGPVGGLIALTVIQDGPEILNPPSAVWRTVAAGALRIVVSVVTAFVVVLAVRAGLVVSSLVEANPTTAYLLLAIAGGYGSNWAKKILESISTRDEERAVEEAEARDA